MRDRAFLILRIPNPRDNFYFRGARGQIRNGLDLLADNINRVTHDQGNLADHPAIIPPGVDLLLRIQGAARTREGLIAPAVVGADNDQIVGAGLYVTRDVEFKGRVAILVVAEIGAIQPDAGPGEDGAEREAEMRAPGRRSGEPLAPPCPDETWAAGIVRPGVRHPDNIPDVVIVSGENHADLSP